MPGLQLTAVGAGLPANVRSLGSGLDKELHIRSIMSPEDTQLANVF